MQNAFLSRRIVRFGMTLLVLVTLAACGGGGKSASSSSSSSSKPSSKRSSSSSATDDASSSSGDFIACNLFDLNTLDSQTGLTWSVTDRSANDKCTISAENGNTVSIALVQTDGQNAQALQGAESQCDTGSLTQQNILDGGYTCEISGVASAGALFKGDNVLVVASAVTFNNASNTQVEAALVQVLQSFAQDASTSSSSSAPDTFTASLSGAKSGSMSGKALCVATVDSQRGNVVNMDYELDDSATGQSLSIAADTINPVNEKGEIYLFDSSNNITGSGPVTVPASTAPTVGQSLGFSFSGQIALNAGGTINVSGQGTCSAVKQHS